MPIQAAVVDDYFAMPVIVLDAGSSRGSYSPGRVKSNRTPACAGGCTQNRSGVEGD